MIGRAPMAIDRPSPTRSMRGGQTDLSTLHGSRGRPRRAVALAEEADLAAPSAGSRNVLVLSLLARAEARLARARPEYAAVLDRDCAGRSTSARGSPRCLG